MINSFWELLGWFIFLDLSHIKILTKSNMQMWVNKGYFREGLTVAGEWGNEYKWELGKYHMVIYRQHNTHKHD